MICLHFDIYIRYNIKGWKSIGFGTVSLKIMNNKGSNIEPLDVLGQITQCCCSTVFS